MDSRGLKGDLGHTAAGTTLSARAENGCGLPEEPRVRPRRQHRGPVPKDDTPGRMRAACRNRTDDLLITSEMLYRLS